MESLTATLKLDGSPFNQGLAAAEKKADEVGEHMGVKMGKQLTHHFISTFGVMAYVEKAWETMKEAQSLRDKAAAEGTTPQKLAAREEVIKRLGDASNVTAEEVNRLADELIRLGEIPPSSELKILATNADTVSRVLSILNRDFAKNLTDSLSGVAAIMGGMKDFFGAMFKGGRLQSPEAVLKAGVVGATTGFFGLDPGKSLAERARRKNEAEEEAVRLAKEEMSVEEKLAEAKFKTLSIDQQIAALAERRRVARNLVEVQRAQFGPDSIEAKRAELALLQVPADPARPNANPHRLRLNDAGGDFLSRIGLGPGRGTFNAQRQLLQESHRQTTELRRIAGILQKNL
jgi:hypothetical protein